MKVARNSVPVVFIRRGKFEHEDTDMEGRHYGEIEAEIEGLLLQAKEC